MQHLGTVLGSMKKNPIEEKCFKRTKSILKLVMQDFANRKLKLGNKVDKNLEQSTCLTSE